MFEEDTFPEHKFKGSELAQVHAKFWLMSHLGVHPFFLTNNKNENKSLTYV